MAPLGQRAALMRFDRSHRVSRSRWVPIALAWIFFACSNGDQGATENSTVPIDELPKQERTHSKPKPMTAMRSSARVIYPSAPADPHTQEVTLGEAGYARLRLASDPEVEGRRVLQHVSENRIYVTSARAALSQELTGQASEESLRWFRLRKEAYAWNSASHWSPDESDSGRLTFHQKGRPAMVANLQEQGGLPESIGYYSSEGTLIQRLANIQWSTGEASVHPVSFRVENSHGILWHESELVLRLGLRMNTGFFLPTDRRPESSALVTTRQAPK